MTFLLVLSFTLVPFLTNDQVASFGLELVDTVLGYLDRIAFGVASVVGDFGLGGILFQLIKSTSTECICTDHGRFESLLLVEVGQFCNGRRFTSSLQADKHDNIRFPFLWAKRLLSRVYEVHQFFKDSLRVSNLLPSG